MLDDVGCHLSNAKQMKERAHTQTKLNGLTHLVQNKGVSNTKALTP